jgi:uncharacterized protein YjbJ (UPF0337 family)
MSTEDKAKNLVDKAAASAKEAAGKITRNESLEREGEADKAKADLKQSGEKVKDTLHDIAD